MTTPTEVKLPEPATVRDSLTVADLPTHPEPHSHAWTDTEKRCLLAWGDSLQSDAQALAGEVERLRAQLDWLSNAVLCCDYGDNNAPGAQIGWCIQASRRNDKPFMFGSSIDAALDASRALAPQEAKQ